MANMSTDALKANLSNPQMGYLWEIIIPTPIGDGDVETFQLRAQSTQIPSRDQGQIVIPYKQTAGVAVPGKLAYTHKWDCTFIEGEDKKVWDAIYSWMQLIVNGITGTGTGDSSIKTDIYLTELSRAGATTLKLKLKGCYVMAIGQVPLSYKEEGFVEYTVTFSFDSVETSS
jgi:hypothetical protein